MTRLKNVKGPPSYGKPWNLLVCQTFGSSKISLSEGEEIIFENFKVANIFNNFFTSVAEKLINKLPKRPIHFTKQFLKDYYQKKNVL